MSAKKPSTLDQSRTAVAVNIVLKAVAAVITVARDIANSQGGRDLGAWLSYGRYELASVMMHGSSSIYPGRAQSPLEQGPDVLSGASSVTEPGGSPVFAGPTIEPLYTEEQMSSAKSAANVAYAMSKADQVNVHQLKFDVANVKHSEPLKPLHGPSPPETTTEVPVSAAVESLVERHLENLRGPESTQPEMSREIAVPNVAPAESMVDRHLQTIASTVEPASPQIEPDVDR